MVTAELAVAIPTVVVVLVLCIQVVSLAVAQMRCTDAARSGARAAARGEEKLAVEQAATAVAPSGARVEIGVRDARSWVRVSVPRAGPVSWLSLGFTPSAEASAAREGA